MEQKDHHNEDRGFRAGDVITDSPVGPGRLCGFTNVGFPQVNGIAVTWCEREDGALFDPFGKSEEKRLKSISKQFSMTPAGWLFRAKGATSSWVFTDDGDVVADMKKAGNYEVQMIYKENKT
jgi:hypothetical protein